MKTIAVVPALIVAGLSLTISPAQAESRLNADEVKALFAGKTFDGVNVQRSHRAFTIYFASDGAAEIAYADGKSATGTWNVTADGQHCVSLSGCAHVIDKGEGVYHKLRDGVQTHVLRNARAGKQL